MKYIDIHCHLDFPDYSTEPFSSEDFRIEGLVEVLQRMEEKEVAAITIGTDLRSSKKAVQIAEQNENIWACIGIHPNHGPSPSQGEGEGGEVEALEKLVSNPKVVAIGECGLDYFRIKDEIEKGNQKKLFKQQIQFALKHDKPLMLHCRNAYDEVLEILESHKSEKLRGNCHFFAGNTEQAKWFLDLGFTMSFTGVITFTEDYDEVIKFLPNDSIMAETDAPFVAPVPHRGKRNEPAFVVEVVKRMAEIRNVGLDEMSEILVKNASRLFDLKIEN